MTDDEPIALNTTPTKYNYVLTFISHNDDNTSFLRNIALYIDKITTSYLPNDDIQFTSTKILSPRAQDHYFTSSNPNIKTPPPVPLQSNLDAIIQRDTIYRKRKSLVAFDMDSTLIKQEVIELIASYAGVEPQVHDITQRAMNNELDFAESLRLRVQLLKGLPIETLYDEIKSKLVFTEGVRLLCRCLKKIGVYLVVLSGGFVPFAEFVKRELEMDYMKANVLGVDRNQKNSPVLNGEVVGEIVDGECKRETVLSLCKKLKIPIESSCMVGDGANDVPAMLACGFGVAWNAKPNVQKVAPCRLNTRSLLDVMYIFGYTDAEIGELLK